LPLSGGDLNTSEHRSDEPVVNMTCLCWFGLPLKQQPPPTRAVIVSEQPQKTTQDSEYPKWACVADKIN